jgi:hypothetical protein
VSRSCGSQVRVASRGEHVATSHAEDGVADYYLRRPAASFSPLPVFVELAGRERGRALAARSAVLEQHFWNDLGGYLFLPELADLLCGVDRPGNLLLTHCELARQSLQGVRTPSAAREEHALARVRILALHANGTLTQEAARAAYLVTDCLLVLWAVAEDVRAAARSAACGESTAVRLSHRYESGNLLSSGARRHVWKGRECPEVGLLPHCGVWLRRAGSNPRREVLDALHIVLREKHTAESRKIKPPMRRSLESPVVQVEAVDVDPGSRLRRSQAGGCTAGLGGRDGQGGAECGTQKKQRPPEGGLAPGRRSEPGGLWCAFNRTDTGVLVKPHPGDRGANSVSRKSRADLRPWCTSVCAPLAVRRRLCTGSPW